MTNSDWRHRALTMPPSSRFATPRGFDLLSVGAGLQPFATHATCFEKVFLIEELRESFSVLGGKGGKPGFAAHGVQRALQKSASQRAPD